MLAVALLVSLAAAPTEFAPLSAPDGGAPPKRKLPQPDAGSSTPPPPRAAKPTGPDIGTEPCGCTLGAPGIPGYLPDKRHLPDGGMGTEVDQNLEVLASWRAFVAKRLKDCPQERRDQILEDNGRWECWQIKAMGLPDDSTAANLADARRLHVTKEVEKLEGWINNDARKARNFGLAFAISFGEVARALDSKAEYQCEWGEWQGPPPERSFPACPHARSYGYGTPGSPGPKVTATEKDPPEQRYGALVWARGWEQLQNTIARDNEREIAELRAAGVGDPLAIKAARDKVNQLCGRVREIRKQESDDHTVSDAFLAHAKVFFATLLWLEPGANDPTPCR